MHEFTPGTSSAISFSSGNTVNSNSLGYAYLLNDFFQVAARLGFGWNRSGGSHWFSASVAIGPVFNYSLSHDIREAFFASLMLGGWGSKYKNWEGMFETEVTLGKRFRLAENVSYKPSVGWLGSWHAGALSNSLTVTPFAFSLHF